MIIKLLVPFLLFSVYGGLFLHQEKLYQERPLELYFPLSAKIQKTALGYLRQLGGEMLFIKANVFIGGVKPGRDPYDYAESLTQHLEGAADLHPEFLDTYYVCNANLPDISPEYAAKANKILEKGMAAMPDNILWPFFIGFNNYFYINDFTSAAKFLKIASETPDAPKFLAHLASTLAAKGGDIQTGIFWLRAMVANEADDKAKEYYQKGLTVFETAYQVQQAIDAFTGRYGEPPLNLEVLVPEFVDEIPQFEGYELSYTAPTLKLLRPHIEEQLRKRKAGAGYSKDALEKILSRLLYIDYLSLPTDYRTAHLFPKK